MKKTLNLISITLLVLVMIPLSFITSSHHTNSTNLASNSSSMAFISSNVENGYYYGRILKYYYANHIEVSDEELKKLDAIFSNSGLSDTQQDLMLQNILGSTINLSIYGSSSDAEFFAEAFTKWLTTPDQQKNKSWEITNNFFMDIFPNLIADGFVLTNDSINKIEEMVENDLIANSSSATYNTQSNTKPANALDLQYNSTSTTNLDTLYWMGGYSLNNIGDGALYYIENQSWMELNDLDSKTLKQQNNEINNILQGWMYDSYTPASNESINEFHNYINNSTHFPNFEALDSHFSTASLDANNNVRLPFKQLYEAYGKKYLSAKSYSDSEIKEIVQDLENQTLYLYNLLFALVGNEECVDNILTAFVIAADIPLQSSSDEDMENVMGYTSSSYYVKNNKFVSSAYSTMVLRPDALDSTDFNDNYKYTFWSSPAKYTVLFHEMGHALDSFGAKLNEYRTEKFKTEIIYNNVYPGNYIFNYENSSNDILIVGVTILIGTIAVIAVISGIVIILSKK